MASAPYKFGYLDASGNEASYQYENCWAVEKTTGPSRLVIAPASNHIALVTQLAKKMREPFGLLYVLRMPRAGQSGSGRYQNPLPLNFAEMEEFLWQFQELFERDARQHLWVGSTDNSSLLVCDHHNVVYACGPLEEFEQILSSNGLTKSDEVGFPKPHVHRYNFEFDEQARQLLNHWQWIQSPRQEDDEP